MSWCLLCDLKFQSYNAQQATSLTDLWQGNPSPALLCCSNSNRHTLWLFNHSDTRTPVPAMDLSQTHTPQHTVERTAWFTSNVPTQTSNAHSNIAA